MKNNNFLFDSLTSIIHVKIDSILGEYYREFQFCAGPVTGPPASESPWDQSAEVKIYWFKLGGGRMWPSCLPELHVNLGSQFEENKIK